MTNNKYLYLKAVRNISVYVMGTWAPYRNLFIIYVALNSRQTYNVSRRTIYLLYFSFTELRNASMLSIWSLNQLLQMFQKIFF